MLLRCLRDVLVQPLGEAEDKAREEQCVDHESHEESVMIDRVPKTRGDTSEFDSDGDRNDEEAPHHDRGETLRRHLSHER